MKRKCVLFWVLISCLLFPLVTLASNDLDDGDSVRRERLVALCKLWGQVKYLHPALAYRTDFDWDAALVTAIPKVREAKTKADFAAAVQGMLEAIGDPVTRVVDNTESGNAGNDGPDREFNYRLTDGDVLVITAGNYFQLWGQPAQARLTAMMAEVPRAKAIVFDLRAQAPPGDYGQLQLASTLAPIERMISTTASLTPGKRGRVYNGYEGGFAISSGQYRSGWFTQNVKRVTPAAGARDIPAVFLLNKYAGVLDSMPEKQAKGTGLIVFEGETRDASFGSGHDVDMGEGLTARVRTTETILEDGTSGDIGSDKVVSHSASSKADAGLEAALGLARSFKPSTLVRKKLPSIAATPRDRSYPDMKYPALEYRLLAAFRIFNTIQFFYPHKGLMERDWTEVLREFVPRFENARDGLEYSLAVAEMMTHIHDSHAYVSGSVINDHFGTFYPPVRVRMIENSLLVTAFTDEKAAAAAGVEIGDTVVKVDGEAARTRFERYAKYISASTPQSNTDKATLGFLNGKDASPVTLTLRTRLGKIKEVRLVRKFEDYTTLYHRERSGDIVKLLSPDIGYADLDRLTPDMIDDMLDRFKDTRAVIFDMRGYPNNVFWILPQRLTAGHDITAARLETPIVGDTFAGDASTTVFQKVFARAPGKSVYKGQTVMLIDERSMSQAEHTGMFLRAANGTKFIGTRTGGANGEITTFSLPGGIGVGFTGQSVRFPDGKQLQRIGLIPDVEIKPTVKGIQSGRDEVVEGAVRYLNKTKSRK